MFSEQCASVPKQKQYTSVQKHSTAACIRVAPKMLVDENREEVLCGGIIDRFRYSSQGKGGVIPFILTK